MNLSNNFKIYHNSYTHILYVMPLIVERNVNYHKGSVLNNNCMNKLYMLYYCNNFTATSCYYCNELKCWEY